MSSCETYLGTLNQSDSTAIPVHVEVTSSSNEDISVSLGQVSEVQDGGQIGTPDQPVLWAVTYSDTPPECQSDNGGTVHWPAGSSSMSWSAWIVVPGAASNTAHRLLFLPSVSLGQSSGGTVQYTSPVSPIVVQCSDSDPAAGTTNYLAVDPATALEHGCTSTGDQGAPSGSTPTTDQICQTRFAGGTSHTVNKVMTYDRVGSLLQVCEGTIGYDHPNAGLSCAIIAAAAVYGPAGTGSNVDTLCDAQGIVSGLESGTVLKEAGDIGCGLVSDLIATGAGTAAAGATADSGPGAVAVGVRTYQALSAGLKLACGSFFNGGIGTALEGHHEAQVASDIVNSGKCLAFNQQHGTSVAAVECR